MTEFEQEIAATETQDLLLILTDQRELYTDEELRVIEEELEKRNTLDVAYALKRARRVLDAENEEEETLTDETGGQMP